LSQLGFGNANLLVLSLDTTSRSGSAALVEEGRVRAELIGDPALTHGQRLPGDLMRLLEEGGASLKELDLLAVAAGPGSFTGLRVGIAAMQGLAFGTGLRIVPISALDALANAGADGRSAVAAWIDAQRGQVFAALYTADGNGLLAEPSSLTPEQTLSSWTDVVARDSLRFVGDGAVRYQETITRHLGRGATVIPGVPALAATIGRMAIERRDRSVEPHAVVPIYIRRPDAEIARQRRSRGE
jgi:tRNA threonylcarbamoyladenosine biosynthesis protein TsaB